MARLLRRRISVGGLMLVILVIGLWLGYRANLARDQKRAVAAVMADRGWVHYADEFAMVRSRSRRATRSGSRAGVRSHRGRPDGP